MVDNNLFGGVNRIYSDEQIDYINYQNKLEKIKEKIHIVLLDVGKEIESIAKKKKVPIKTKILVCDDGYKLDLYLDKIKMGHLKVDDLDRYNKLHGIFTKLFYTDNIFIVPCLDKNKFFIKYGYDNIISEKIVKNILEYEKELEYIEKEILFSYKKITFD
jgi:hypothetical protein